MCVCVTRSHFRVVQRQHGQGCIQPSQYEEGWMNRLLVFDKC